MLSDETITAIADELVEAGRTRVPIERLTARYPDMNVQDSYRVQDLWRRRSEANGRRLAGRKIGLTSRAMQAAVGITEPDYGIIFDDMVLENGSIIPWDEFTHPRVEVELAFVLGKDPSVDPTPPSSMYCMPRNTLFRRWRSWTRVSKWTVGPSSTPLATTPRWEQWLLAGTPSTPMTWICAGSQRSSIRTRRRRNGCRRGRSQPPGSRSLLAGKRDRCPRRWAWSRRNNPCRFLHPPTVGLQRGDTIAADYGKLGTITCRFE